MSTLHPFRALRPRPERVAEVACVPYDVINTEEARVLARGKPLSFLHVIRPEIDLPTGTDEHSDAVYSKGAENLEALARGEHSIQEASPAVYAYRLEMEGREQTGIFGCVSVAEYDNDVILKHENTRPAKEEDRTRHILSQQAHAEPVMLTYRDDPAVDRLVADAVRSEALYDFVAEDGVRHTIWKVAAPEPLVEAFRQIDRLYVADGHHRCKAASRAAADLRADGRTGEQAEFEYFPAVLFPMGQMKIMAYNRIIRRLPMPADELLRSLEDRMRMDEGSGRSTPEAPGEIAIYLDGRWHSAILPESRQPAVEARLDVARLSEHLLEPIFGIEDQRTDPNIDFVGGIRGTRELERLVDGGGAQLAISMYPTSIEELVAVSNAGKLMPPKSTWFEPKLRSGLLIHRF